MRSYSFSIDSRGVLVGDPRHDHWVAANEAVRGQSIHNAVFELVDFEHRGRTLSAILLVACEEIGEGESVCVWYGDSFQPLRSWEVADPGKLMRVTEDELKSFLMEQHCSVDGVADSCVPETPSALREMSRLPPLRQPSTTCDV